jgi:hypothetical protein
VSSGWTYRVSWPGSAEAARAKLAEAWGGTVDGDAIRSLSSMTVVVEADPFDGYDLAVDFYGAADRVPVLAEVLLTIFPRVSEPVWA